MKDKHQLLEFLFDLFEGKQISIQTFKESSYLYLTVDDLSAAQFNSLADTNQVSFVRVSENNKISIELSIKEL